MLEIEMEFIRGMLFVRLEGILNKFTSKKLSECLDKMINEQGVRYFIINLEYLESIDREGVKIIKKRYSDVKMHDGKLIVCGYTNKSWSFSFDSELIEIEKSKNELTAFNLINI